jgi:hypothetical protein
VSVDNVKAKHGRVKLSPVEIPWLDPSSEDADTTSLGGSDVVILCD